MSKHRKQVRTILGNIPLDKASLEAMGAIKISGKKIAEMTSAMQAAMQGVALAESMGKTDGCNLIIDDGKQCWEVRIVREDGKGNSKSTIQ